MSASLSPLSAVLTAVPHFTPASIRANRTVPEHLLVLGGDAEACAIAQSYRRLGADVTIVAGGSLLSEEDRDLVALLREALVDDGVAVYDRTRISRLERRDGGIGAYLHRGAVLHAIEASHVLVASDRPSRRRRSTLRWGGTPVRVTRTDPVLAHAGLTERHTRRVSDGARVLRGYADDPELGGRHHLKASCTEQGTLLGVTIVGPAAFEHLQPWILALDAGLDIDALAGLPRVAAWFTGAARASHTLSVLTH